VDILSTPNGVGIFDVVGTSECGCCSTFSSAETQANSTSAIAKPAKKRKRATSAPPSPERPARKAQRPNRSSWIIHDSEDEVEESDDERGDVDMEEVDDGQCTEEDVSRAYARIHADRLAEGCNKAGVFCYSSWVCTFDGTRLLGNINIGGMINVRSISG
jgi:hypothetical protein